MKTITCRNCRETGEPETSWEFCNGKDTKYTHCGFCGSENVYDSEDDYDNYFMEDDR